MEIVKGETWRDKREEILGEERATLLAKMTMFTIIAGRRAHAEDVASAYSQFSPLKVPTRTVFEKC
jgi:hypothetical protein